MQYGGKCVMAEIGPANAPRVPNYATRLNKRWPFRRQDIHLSLARIPVMCVVLYEFAIKFRDKKNRFCCKEESPRSDDIVENKR